MAETATKLPIHTTESAAGKPAPRWTPFDTLRRQIDGLFEDFAPWRQPGQSLLNIDLSFPWSNASLLAPATDVVAKDNTYEITAELPGLDEKNIEVKVADGTLTIKGEKKESSERKEKDYYLSERRYGSFFRSFALPQDVDAARISATFAKGILTVTLPKAAAAKANGKKIEVKAA